MATKFGQKNKIAQSSIPSKKSRNCKQVNKGLLNSNMLPEYSTEPRESPWQPKLCKNKPKFGRNQFSKSYGYNVCVCGTVFDVEEFKYANKNFRGAKGVAIATKFSFVQGRETFFARRIGFTGLANSNMLPEFFREQMTLLWQPNLGKKILKKLQ